jgi:geranylgeranyl pyrophosphate synthase
VASAELGALAAGAGDDQVRALRAYAWDLGLCFQILDDLSDHGGSEALLGKNVGQDADRPSFVSVLGRERAAEAAEAAVHAAGRALAPFGPGARPLGLLLEALRDRVAAEASPR